MIEKLRYLLVGILTLALAGGVVSCNNDDQELNEWLDVPYVFAKGQTSANDFARTFTVIETEGLTDKTPVVYTFRVALSRPATSDVAVELTPQATGNISDIMENTMILSAEKTVIPAGQLLSEEVVFTVDPAFLGVKDAQGSYDPTVFTVKIGTPRTADERVKLSTKTNKITLTFKKEVKAYLNYASGTPANAVMMDRSAWVGVLGPNVEGVPGNLYDGKTSTDAAANNAPWEFTIDTGAATEMLGINTRHWSSSYSPSQLELLSSMDGTTWKSQGILSISRAATQNMRFLKPVTARYVKYRVLAPNSRTDVTEFNIYIAKQ